MLVQPCKQVKINGKWDTCLLSNVDLSITRYISGPSYWNMNQPPMKVLQLQCTACTQTCESNLHSLILWEIYLIYFLKKNLIIFYIYFFFLHTVSKREVFKDVSIRNFKTLFGQRKRSLKKKNRLMIIFISDFFLAMHAHVYGF